MRLHSKLLRSQRASCGARLCCGLATAMLLCALCCIGDVPAIAAQQSAPSNWFYDDSGEAAIDRTAQPTGLISEANAPTTAGTDFNHHRITVADGDQRFSDSYTSYPHTFDPDQEHTAHDDSASSPLGIQFSRDLSSLPTTTIAMGVGIVAAAILLLSMFSKRPRSKVEQRLPGDIVEVLGQAPLAAGQQLRLIRLGHKVVLVAVGHQRAEPLAEITDGEEVERILEMCAQQRGGRLSETMRQWTAKLCRPSTRRSSGSLSLRDLEANSGPASRTLFEA